MRVKFRNLVTTIKNRISQGLKNIFSGADSYKEDTSGTNQVAKSMAETVSTQAKNILKSDSGKVTLKRQQLVNKLSPMVVEANMKLNILRQQGLRTASAFAAWERAGKITFSVSGKSYQELQHEYWRVKKFLDASTSTVSGAIENMRRIGTDLMGMKLEYLQSLPVQDLVKVTTDYFEIVDKVKENLESAGKGADAMKYQKIFNEVADYIKGSDIDMITASAEQLEQAAKTISDYVQSEKAYEEEIMKW